LNRPLNWLVFGLLILSFIGFVDATYLAAKYYLGEPVTCLVFSGCDAVATSPYAALMGVPISLPGAVYYAAVFFLAVLYLDIKKSWVIRLIVSATLLGFGVSLYLTYLQVFVIKAICFYCVVSAADSTSLFVLSMVIMKKLENNESELTKNQSGNSERQML
jgi:uncharacterized membrane protein